jgi:uncharacterized protein (TIGR00369 family)
MTREEMQARVRAGVPLGEAWGVEVLEAAEGRALLRLPRDPLLLRPGNTVSGPALMGLADMAMWAALLTLTEGRDESLTANLAITFLRPAGPGPVLAEARVIKRGRTLSYGEVLLRAEGAAEPAAHVTTSWAAARRG